MKYKLLIIFFATVLVGILFSTQKIYADLGAALAGNQFTGSSMPGGTSNSSCGSSCGSALDAATLAGNYVRSPWCQGCDHAGNPDAPVDTRGSIVTYWDGAPDPICFAIHYVGNGYDTVATKCGQGSELWNGSQSMDPGTYTIAVSVPDGYSVDWNWICTDPHGCGGENGSGSGPNATVNVFFRSQTFLYWHFHRLDVPNTGDISVTCGGGVQMWTCNSLQPNNQYNVSFFADGAGSPFQTVPANQYVPMCSGGSNPQWYFGGIPSQYLDGYSHSFRAQVNDSYNTTILPQGGNTTSFACAPPNPSGSLTATAAPQVGCTGSTTTTHVTWHVDKPYWIVINAFNEDWSFAGTMVNGNYGTDGSFDDTGVTPPGKHYILYIYEPGLGAYWYRNNNPNDNWVAYTHVPADYAECGYANASCSISGGLTVAGWACDPNHPDTGAHTGTLTGFNYDNVQALAFPTANQPYGSIPSVWCKDPLPQNTANHGVSFTLPYTSIPQAMRGSTHTIYGYVYNATNYGEYAAIQPGSPGSLTVTCPNYVSSWIQTKGEDVRMEPMNNSIPSTSVCGSQGYTSVANTSGTPGISFGGGSAQSHGAGKASVTNWQVGDSTYAELFAPIRRTSVAYVRKLLTQKGITPTELSTALTATRRCSTYTSCDITGLTGGTQANPAVYIASGDLTIVTPSITFTNTYIIIVTGTLTLTGQIHVTPGANANLVVIAGNITIPASLGVSPTSCSPSPMLEGLYSADGNITIASSANISTNTPDLQLSVAGSLVANAGKTGGRLTNNRDLISNNVNYPSVVVTERPDLILTLPPLLQEQSSFSQEVAP